MHDLSKIYNEVKKQFPEVHSKLIPFDKRSFMWSSPITNNIYYNEKQIKETNFSKSALMGVLAHELAHQVDYKQMNFVERLFLRIQYTNYKFKRRIEIQTDLIAVQRGFGKELIQLYKEAEKRFNATRFRERIKPFHLTPSEIQTMIRLRK